jgi:hypothetical protein
MARFGVRVYNLYSPENRVFNSNASRRGGCERAVAKYFSNVERAASIIKIQQT